ncbi:MAG: class I SAM-dependent methyltransferase [Planctomycetes bacterium]|nr:class I SAM-dependent methyltransferase [Planctomycetota bacterium]
MSTTELPILTSNDRLTAHSLPNKPPAQEAWSRLETEIVQLDRILRDAERAAKWNRGVIPATYAEWVQAQVSRFAAALHRELGPSSDLDVAVRGELGRRVQTAVLRRLESSDLVARIYRKPRGYAGDYGTIDLMYREVPSGVTQLGLLIDRSMRTQPACRAVVHRRALLAEEIRTTVADTVGRPARILSLACGPAAELFDVATDPHIRTRVSATCVDIDNQALDHVAKRAAHEGLAPCFTRHRGNLVHLALGRQHLELPPQDLVYSIGLIDYFGDSFVVRLLDWIHEQLATGGRVILGNFHPNNPSRELMEHVLDWHLVHRDEAAMHRLFRASRFGTGCSKIRFEGEGINLFAECRKA